MKVVPFYQDEAVTLYCGDCRDVLPLLPAVDHVVTDPPYDDDTHAGARTSSACAGNPSSLDSVRVGIDFEGITEAELRASLEAVRVRRWVVATMDWRHIADFEKRPPAGMRFVRFGIWVKPNGAPQFTGDRPATGWEGVCIMHAATGKMRWNGGGKHGVWTVKKETLPHPTGKPLKLVGQFVQQFTDPGDLVLDPYAGGGSILEACKLMGRRAIGIERKSEYCAMAAVRLRQGVLFGASA